jgi:hypothetical protein
VSLDPSSRLWVEGTSNVRDFICTAGSLTVNVESNGDAGLARRVAAGEKAITAVDVNVPAHSLDCANNKKMTEHMLKAIKADENPVRMTDFGLKPPSLMLGAFKVHDPVVVHFDLLLKD